MAREKRLCTALLCSSCNDRQWGRHSGGYVNGVCRTIARRHTLRACGRGDRSSALGVCSPMRPITRCRVRIRVVRARGTQGPPPKPATSSSRPAATRGHSLQYSLPARPLLLRVLHWCRTGPPPDQQNSGAILVPQQLTGAAERNPHKVIGTARASAVTRRAALCPGAWRTATSFSHSCDICPLTQHSRDSFCSGCRCPRTDSVLRTTDWTGVSAR